MKHSLSVPNTTIKNPQKYPLPEVNYLPETPSLISQEAFNILSEVDKAEIAWNVAQPLLNIPPYIEKAKLDPKSLMTYRKVAGSKKLTEAVNNYFSRQKIDCNDENVIIGSGVFDIFGNICKLLDLKNSQQEIIITTPIYGAFYTFCKNNGFKVDFLGMTEADDWQVNPEKLRKVLSENKDIRILLLNFPNNPTGKTLSEESAKGIAKVLEDYPYVIVVSDEILRDIFLKKGVESFSIASIPGMENRTIVIDSPAKSRALASSGVAFAYFPFKLAKAYRDLRDYNVAPEYVQEIVADSLEDNLEVNSYLEANNKEYCENISHIKEQLVLLNKSLCDHFHDSEGSAYIKPFIDNPESGNVYLLDFSGLKEKFMLCDDGKKFESGLDVTELLLGVGIGVVPGECFFLPKESMTIRIPLAIPQTEVSLGFKKITEVIVTKFRNQPKSSINHEGGGQSI
ncbi:MAG: aspartate/methionine/tyrosine aminotransferase [Lentimonas sp.]|jgi:aspartate/methionine/tyrosine aminotransferase